MLRSVRATPAFSNARAASRTVIVWFSVLAAIGWRTAAGAVAFGMLPKLSASFRTVPKLSAGFGTFPDDSEKF
jgi:hypothetical protein